MTTRMQIRRDTASNWTSANPVLASGEIGYETDTGYMKIGNGSTAWTSLAYGPNGGGTGTFTTVNAFLNATAGTTTSAPILLNSGTLNTTAQAGAIEYDGNALYGAVSASERGVIPTNQYVVLTSTNTLTSQTAAQPLFDGGGGPAAGALTLSVGTYQFECMFSLTGMSTNSGSFGFSITGTATKTYSYTALAQDAALATATTVASTFNTGANTALAIASASTTGYALIRGVIRVTVAGTIIPNVSLSSGAAAVVGADSYFLLNQLGSSSAAYVGNWS